MSPRPTLGRMIRLFGPALLAALLLACPGAEAAERVGAAVVFAVDVSGSVNDERFELQRAGVAAIFTDPGIDQIVADGLAVALMEWSDEPRVVVPWTILRTREEAHALADRIVAEPRPVGYSTGLSLALLAAADLLDACPCAPLGRIIDLSGDGPNNGPMSTPLARDAVVARGIQINGLPIVTKAVPDLAEWYASNVVGGPGAFLEVAQGFEDFARAMRRKFLLEISAATHGSLAKRER